MKLAALILVLPLLGCAGMTKAANAPADPANPEGPTQGQVTVQSAAGVVGMVNPIAGALVAAMGAAGLGVLAKKKVA